MSTPSTKEKCVMCGSTTDYDVHTHIDLRHGYIEGMGQLCFPCYTGSSRKTFIVDERTVMDTPNDMELGHKIRSMFYESKGLPAPDFNVSWESVSRSR